METIDSGLKRLEGQEYQAAFQILGFPDSERQIDGQRVFTWQTRKTGSTSSPVRATSTAYVGGEVVTVETWATHTSSYDYICEIDIIVDKLGIIRLTRFQGDSYSCNKYSEKLQLEEKPRP